MDSSSGFWPYLDCWQHMDSVASDKPITAAIQEGVASAACACGKPCCSRQAELMAVDGCTQVAGAPSSMLRWFADSSDNIRPFAPSGWDHLWLEHCLASLSHDKVRFRDAMGIIAHVCQLRTDHNFWSFELMMSPDSRQMLSAWTSLHRASNLAQRGPARRRMVTCWALWQLGARISADKNEQYMSSWYMQIWSTMTGSCWSQFVTVSLA